MEKLILYIQSSDTHPTLEGPNGVGKTSLVSVAGYKLYKMFEDGDSESYIPISNTFQLTSSDTLKSFKQRVFLEIAQQFIKSHAILKTKGYSVPEINEINSWLNSPLFHSTGFGASIAGYGGTATRSTTPSNSTGFNESGFISFVNNCLINCFPSRSSGGFICVIDNLELLETSKSARELLESIRDELLNIKGLRWVLS